MDKRRSQQLIKERKHEERVVLSTLPPEVTQAYHALLSPDWKETDRGPVRIIKKAVPDLNKTQAFFLAERLMGPLITCDDYGDRILDSLEEKAMSPEARATARETVARLGELFMAVEQEKKAKRQAKLLGKDESHKRKGRE